jgi:hypothetical protein
MTPDEIAKLIPKEVLQAVAAALSTRQSTRTAIAAGLAAWPGMTRLQEGRISPEGLFLPLYTETQNEPR